MHNHLASSLNLIQYKHIATFLCDQRTESEKIYTLFAQYKICKASFPSYDVIKLFQEGDALALWWPFTQVQVYPYKEPHFKCLIDVTSILMELSIVRLRSPLNSSFSCSSSFIYSSYNCISSSTCCYSSCTITSSSKKTSNTITFITQSFNPSFSLYRNELICYFSFTRLDLHRVWMSS